MQPGDLFLWENTILRNIYRAPWAKRHRSTAPAVWSTGDVCWKHRRNEHRRRFFKNENCRLRHGSTTQQSTQNLCMVYVCVWVWFEVWNVKCNVSDTLNVPPQSQFEMTPSVVAEYRRGGVRLALDRFSHSQINQEQTEALRQGWGRHRLTPLLRCEIILGPPASVIAVWTWFPLYVT